MGSTSPARDSPLCRHASTILRPSALLQRRFPVGGTHSLDVCVVAISRLLSGNWQTGLLLDRWGRPGAYRAAAAPPRGIDEACATVPHRECRVPARQPRAWGSSGLNISKNWILLIGAR